MRLPRAVGQASSLPVRAASCRPFPTAGGGQVTTWEHGAGMPREPAGKDACPTRAPRAPDREQETEMRPTARQQRNGACSPRTDPLQACRSTKDRQQNM